MLQPQIGDARPRLAQHRFRDIGAEDAQVRRVLRQRDAGADADLEHASADAVGGENGGLPALAEHPAEHQVIDRRPAVIGPLDHLAIEIQFVPCRRVS